VALPLLIAADFRSGRVIATTRELAAARTYISAQTTAATTISAGGTKIQNRRIVDPTANGLKITGAAAGVRRAE
jgi:hypothetical protein